MDVGQHFNIKRFVNSRNTGGRTVSKFFSRSVFRVWVCLSVFLSLSVCLSLSFSESISHILSLRLSLSLNLSAYQSVSLSLFNQTYGGGGGGGRGGEGGDSASRINPGSSLIRASSSKQRQIISMHSNSIKIALALKLP